MKLLGVVVALIILLPEAVFSQAEKPSASNPDTAIRAVMQSQADAWNHHDLEQFMAGYWNSPDLTFFSGTTETRGWAPTLERYRRTYQAEGHSMGTLSFSELQVEPLGADAAFVRGKFQLAMPSGEQPNGVFTLIFRKFPEGWRIVHDHTCTH